MNSEQGYKLTPQFPSASQRARNSITVLQFIPKGFTPLFALTKG